MTSEPAIRVEQAGPVGVLTLANSKAGNCLSMAIWDAMQEALHGFEADPAVRVVLVQAEGRHFCTGADLSEVKQVLATPDALVRFLRTGHAALCAFEASRLPVVGAVQGLCLAGGLELMLACDLVVAAESARFGDQHAQFGLLPGWGGSQRLTRIVGLRRANDLFLSARWISAEVAERWGLVNAVVPDAQLAEEASALCRRLAERSPAGLAVMKRLARDGLDGSLAEGLLLEQRVAPAVLTGADALEGLAAFEGKREPRFLPAQTGP